MTDVAGSLPGQAPAARPARSLFEQDAQTQARNAAERRFRLYGVAALLVGLAVLVTLLATILAVLVAGAVATALA